jgi:hypothetical protein
MPTHDEALKFVNGIQPILVGFNVLNEVKEDFVEACNHTSLAQTPTSSTFFSKVVGLLFSSAIATSQ